MALDVTLFLISFMINLLALQPCDNPLLPPVPGVRAAKAEAPPGHEPVKGTVKVSEAMLRAQRLRSAALAGKGRVAEALDVLQKVRQAREQGSPIRTSNIDPGLELDYADLLSRTTRWSGAIPLYNQVWKGVEKDAVVGASVEMPAPWRSPALRERAMESRRALRSRLGSSLELQYGRTDSQGEGKAEAMQKLAWQMDSRDRLLFSWTSRELGDFTNASGQIFERDLELGEVQYQRLLSPRAQMSLGYGMLHGHSEDDSNFMTEFTFGWPDGSSLNLSWNQDYPWLEPIDAAALDGQYDQGGVRYFRPLGNSWFLGADALWRSYRLYRGSAFLGRDSRYSLSLGREIFRTHYGAANPIRYVNLSLSREIYDSEQDSLYQGLIDLVDRSRTYTMNLFAHLILAHRSTLDLSAFIGHDPDRGLTFGKANLYGFTGEYRLDMDSCSELFIRGSLSTESPDNLFGGRYRTLYIGLIFWID